MVGVRAPLEAPPGPKPRDRWGFVRRAISSRVEAVRDGDVSWRPLGALALVVLLSVVTGPLVALGLNWSAISTYGSQARPTPAAAQATPLAQASPAAQAARLAQPTPLAQAAPLAEPTLSAQAPPLAQPTLDTRAAPLAVATPAAIATPLGIATSPGLATPVAPLAAAVTPAAAPTPDADQAWAALQPRLDAVWGTDTQASVAILDDFHARFPDSSPARDKLYAALIASANQLARGGDEQAAADTFARAVALAPERPEAHTALDALTPTAIPVPAPSVDTVPAAPAVRAPAPAPRPTAVLRPVAPPAVPQAPPPTPTKIPFKPPGGP